MPRHLASPLLLLVAGIASAIYGAKHHVVAVVQEREEEISIQIPTPFGPGPMGRRCQEDRRFRWDRPSVAICLRACRLRPGNRRPNSPR